MLYLNNSAMNIGFYGHSAASWMGDDRSFVDQIKKKYNANIVNIGVPQGSEERILFDLKKTKAIDIAVIFHSIPKYIFIPKCNRDVSISTVPGTKAKYFWSERSTQPISKSQFEQIFFSYSNIKEVFNTPEEYVDAMSYLKEYFYHPDLVVNRYQSAMLMIDNYLINKKIKCFHSINPAQYPPWMTLQSGTVDFELSKLVTGGLPNNLSQVENIYVARYLGKWIDSVISDQEIKNE